MRATSDQTKMSKKLPPSRQAHACPTCKKVFSRAEFVRRHQRIKHVGEESFDCKICAETFDTHQQLTKHYKTTHDSDQQTTGELVKAHIPSPVPVAPAKISNGSQKEVSLQIEILPVVEKRVPSTAAISNSDSSSPDSRHWPPLSVQSPPPTSSEFKDDIFQQLTDDLTPLPALSNEKSTSDTKSIIIPSSSQHITDYHTFLSMEHPESLAWLGLNNQTGISPLDLQLLVDSCNFPGMGGYVAQGRVRTTNGQGQFCEFHIRVRALIGTNDDWIDSEKGLGGLMHQDQQWALSKGTRFFDVTQPFCIGYKSQFEVPPLPKLSRYGSMAAAFVLDTIQVAHPPTLLETTPTPQLAFALAVAGAGFEVTGRSFHDQMTREKRIFASMHLFELDLTPEEGFSVIQSLTLYNLMALSHMDENQRRYSEVSHETLVTTYRNHDLPTLINENPWCIPSANATAKQVDQCWRKWIRIETCKRLTFLVFLQDLELLCNHGVIPRLQPYELSIDSPAPDILWNAESATEWHALIRSSPRLSERPTSFLANLDAILSLDWPSPGSTAATVLPRLRTCHSLTIHILGLTLRRLEGQLKAQIEEEKSLPFVPPLDDVGKEKPIDALRRVENGFRVLTTIGGWDSRPRYFKGIEPLFYG